MEAIRVPDLPGAKGGSRRRRKSYFDEDGRQRLPGRFSEIERQIDVIVRGTFAGLPDVHTMIVDCKHFTRALDVTHVEAFGGLVDDVNADFGLLVTSKGFSGAARRRADSIRGIRLDVVEFDQLAVWLPRNPSVAMTAGASTATLTYHDQDGHWYTEWVPLELAHRILDSRKSSK